MVSPTCAALPEGAALTRLHVAVTHPKRKLLIWDRNCLVARKRAAVMGCRWEEESGKIERWRGGGGGAILSERRTERRGRFQMRLAI